MENRKGPVPRPDSKTAMYFLRMSADDKIYIQEYVSTDEARMVLKRRADKNNPKKKRKLLDKEV